MRVAHELTRDESLRRLRRAHLGVVAFTWGAEIHAMPVNIGCDGDAVWFRAVDGTKRAAASAGARMAVVVHDSSLVDRDGWSVTARGHASLSDDGPTDGLLPQVRPWIDDARDAPWVRLVLDRVDGRELAPPRRGTTGAPQAPVTDPDAHGDTTSHLQPRRGART